MLVSSLTIKIQFTMERCPKCNCGAEFTNKAKYYAAYAGASVVSLGVGMVASVVNRKAGGLASMSVGKELTKNVRKHYKCTNSWCNYEWDED